MTENLGAIGSEITSVRASYEYNIYTAYHPEYLIMYLDCLGARARQVTGLRPWLWRAGHLRPGGLT